MSQGAETVAEIAKITNQPSNATASNKELLSIFDTLFALTNQLLEEQDAENHTGQQVADFDEFSAWLEREKFPDSIVKVGKSSLSEGNGLIAQREIQKDELLISVPKRFMMTTTTALECDKLGEFLKTDPLLRQLPSTALALHLVVENRKKEASFWSPYIAILPREFNTSLFFNAEELKLLSSSPVQKKFIKDRISTLRQYCYICSKLNAADLGLKDLTYDEFRWAMTVVTTRQNRIPIGGTNEAPVFGFALIPVWDMANHYDPGEITTFFEAEKDALQCYAIKSYKEGDQVYIYYGPRSNDELLLFSGFVPSYNSSNYVNLPLSISNSDPLCQAKLGILRLFRLDTFKEYPLLNNEIAIELLMFLRINSLSKSGATALQKIKGEDFLNAVRTQISVENEYEALNFLKTRLNLYSMRYPKSLADYTKKELFHPKEPEKLIDAVGGVNSLLALQICFTEKEIMMNTINIINQKLSGLQI